MEGPIYLAVDTSENWEKSSTALGKSELAIEIAGKRGDNTPIKYLLIGDGKAAGPNHERLRATVEFIAELPEALRKVSAAATNEESARKAAIEAEAAARLAADKDEAAAREAADKAETAARQASDRTEAAAREAADKAEAEARQKGDSDTRNYTDSRIASELAQIHHIFEQEISGLRNELQNTKSLVEYLIRFIEDNIGPFGGEYPLVTESGFYLVTETNDQLVAE